MGYADEEFYKNEFLLGRAPVITSAFEYYVKQAGVELDRYIKDKDIAAYNNEVKLCCCEVAESIFRYDGARNTGALAPLVSYSNDGQSGTYDMSQYTSDGHAQEIKSIIYRYLGGTGLLFQGV